MITVMKNGFMCRLYDYGGYSTDVREAWYFKTMKEVTDWLNKSALKEMDLKFKEYEEARKK